MPQQHCEGLPAPSRQVTWRVCATAAEAARAAARKSASTHYLSRHQPVACDARGVLVHTPTLSGFSQTNSILRYDFRED